jgi:hypothetical protein
MTYPNDIDPVVRPVDGSSLVNAASIDDICDTLNGVTGELGAVPSGGSATVAARLTGMDTAISARAFVAHSHGNSEIDDGAITEPKLNDSLKSGVRAYKGTLQNVANATSTRVVFATENFDERNEWWNGYRFEADYAGRYLVMAQVTYGTSIPFEAQAWIKCSSGVVYDLQPIWTNVNADNTIKLADLVELAAGQYIEIWTVHWKGSQATVKAGADLTHVSIARALS